MSVATTVAERDRRPWLAMVAVPLEMIAALCLGFWWTLPALIVCVWWWADSGWRWAWLAGIEAGLIGTQWAYVGAVLLGEFPGLRLLVCAIWVGSAMALAVVSAYNRRQ